MLGRKRRQRAFQQGKLDEMRKQRNDALRRLGHRMGDDTEPPDLSSDERAAYLAGRQSGE
jgi:hypothetical protein